MATKILIIDSNEQFIQSLREPLARLKFDITSAPVFHDISMIRKAPAPGLVVFTVHSMSAAPEILQTIRRESQVPIILRCESCESEERAMCLERGADDCVCGNLSVREIVARIQNILRRAGAPESLLDVAKPREWRFKGLSLQSNRRRIQLDSETVELTTAEFDLLKMLILNSYQALSREMILDRLRGIEWESVDRSVDILVSRLRDKLKDDPRKPRFVRTVRSIGYQFVGEPEAD